MGISDQTKKRGEKHLVKAREKQDKTQDRDECKFFGQILKDA